MLIFCASYNGVAPDNAAKFMKWLQSDMPANALANVRYAVFGCGNSDWAATYQNVPRLLDKEMQAHGATNVYERGEGDARGDLDGQFEKWFAGVRKVVAKELNLESGFGNDGNRSFGDETLS